MKKTVTRIVAALALLCLMVMGGCAAPSTTPTTDSGRKVLLVVSFGTSYDSNRELSIGGVEKALATAYPDFEVRRAFTSQIIIDILAKRGTNIDNVEQAMKRLVDDGVKNVVIQPTTIMSGYEYMDLVTETTPYKDSFDSFAIGSPLLTTDDDYKEVAAAISSRTAQYAAADTAVIFMGHGTSAPSDATYSKLAGVLSAAGHKNYFVGTVEGSPTLADVIKQAKDAKVSKVVLQPLMVVAGDHATNDMAGDEPDSWKSQFTKAGFKVETLLEGLGQNPDIQKIYVAHAKVAIAAAAANQGKGTGTMPSTSTSGSPVAAHQIKDGTYSITATTGSSMFKIVDVKLKVEPESMLATVTLSGAGYGRLALGTAENAAKSTSGFIEYKADGQGRHVYLVPVSRLNKPMSVAAESMKTPGKWYDHTVTFLSEKIPADAITK